MMARLRSGMLGLVIALLWTGTVPASAQSTANTGLTLRQRLDNERTDARRTAGERPLSRTTTQQETRRQLLLRQRNSAIGTQRSVPILPKTSRSSVVVTQ